MTFSSAAPVPASKTSTQAVWSLVLGILSIGCLWLLGSIPAILLGIAAVKNIDRSGGTLKGRSLGIAGIVTGTVGIFTGIVTIGIFAASAMPAYNSIQKRVKEQSELVRPHEIAKACSSYALDNDGRYPESLATLVEKSYLPESVIAPSSAPGSTFLYRPGLTASSAGEVFLAAPLPIKGKRTIGRIGEGVEFISEDQFQSDYAHLFP